MNITGTYFNYYQICHRKLWLFGNSICFEQFSDLVLEGKLIHESSYGNRSAKFEEQMIDGVKVDYYDRVNKVIHEIKKSNKLEKAHIWQLKYYIYVFEKNGIDDVSGILEYSKLKKRLDVTIDDNDKEEITRIEKAINNILESDVCPSCINKALCKQCSYYEFCYVGEYEEDILSI